jgi:hypothetical protein
MDNIISYIKASLRPADETEVRVVEYFDKDIFNSMRQDGIPFAEKINPNK